MTNGNLIFMMFALGFIAGFGLAGIALMGGLSNKQRKSGKPNDDTELLDWWEQNLNQHYIVGHPGGFTVFIANQPRSIAQVLTLREALRAAKKAAEAAGQS
jgi:hypothetical protein